MANPVFEQAARLRSDFGCVVISPAEFDQAVAQSLSMMDELRTLAERHSSTVLEVPMWGVDNGKVPISLLTLCAQKNCIECFDSLWFGASDFAAGFAEGDVWRVRVLLDFEQSLHEWNAWIDLDDPVHLAIYKSTLDQALVGYFQLVDIGARARLDKLLHAHAGLDRIRTLCGDCISDQIRQWDDRLQIRNEFKVGGAPIG